jgi:hypothetical protein
MDRESVEAAIAVTATAVVLVGVIYVSAGVVDALTIASSRIPILAVAHLELDCHVGRRQYSPNAAGIRVRGQSPPPVSLLEWFFLRPGKVDVNNIHMTKSSHATEVEGLARNVPWSRNVRQVRDLANK